MTILITWSMIVFSESWWIGTKEENPEEARLDFPKELSQVDTFQAEQTEFDFRGGAGAADSAKTLATPETGSQPTETDSPEVEMEEFLSEDGEFLDDKIQVTPLQVKPVRQSQRNSGKKFNFAETSPEHSSDESGDNTSDEKDEKPPLEPDSSTRGRGEVQAGTTVANLFKKAEKKTSVTSKEKPSSKD